MLKGRREITNMSIMFIVVYLILSTSGVILMKLGGNAGTIAIANSTLNFNINIISLLGLCCYVLSFLLFTKIVTSYDLSYIIPICTGVVQVLTLLAAIFIIKEQVSVYGILGFVLIVIGIVVINIKK